MEEGRKRRGQAAEHHSRICVDEQEVGPNFSPRLSHTEDVGLVRSLVLPDDRQRAAVGPDSTAGGAAVES
jgi:hypothetical protein